MSFYDDASLVFLAGGAAGKDGKAYNLKPDGSLGSELIADGGFDSASGWTKGTGWSISGGVASCDGTQTATTDLHETAKNGLVDGKTYRIEYTITSYSAGSIRVKAGNTGFGTYRSATGTYVENIVAGVTSFTAVQFNADADFVGSIDNVSCKEMDVADFTFTRGTNLTATRVGKDGYIEKGRENLLLQSNQFDTSPWTSPSADVTGGQAGRDGSNDAWELSLNGVFGHVDQLVSASGVNTLSFYAKSGTSDFTRPYIAGPNQYAYFDLLNGQTGTQTGVASSIEDAGNGWWRCSFTVEGTITEVRLHVADSINTIGTSTSGTIYIQDAQLEQGLVATDYIETGATTATAGLLEDEPRFDYTGGGCPALLLEPTRTNLFVQSEYLASSSIFKTNSSFTTNQGISPEGLNNAAKMNEGTASGNLPHNFYYSGIQNSKTYTISFYAKKIDRDHVYVNIYSGVDSKFVFYDLSDGSVATTLLGDVTASINDAGNGWYRISYTRDTAASGSPNFRIGMSSVNGTVGYQGNGSETLFYGVQWEEGSYPTSYIPTYGSSATRAKEGAADSYDYMNLSAANLYSNTSYTYFLDINLPYDVGTSGSLWKDNDNLSTNGGFQLRKTSPTGSYVGITTHDGSTFVGFTTNVLTGRLKIAIIYNNGEVSVYYNGVQSQSAISVTGWDQSTNHFKFGDGGNGTYEIQQFLYIPTALSNNDCEILTGATSYNSFADMATSTALNYTIYE